MGAICGKVCWATKKMNPNIEQLQTYFAGEWRDGSGPSYSTSYPADGSLIAQLHACTVSDVDVAVCFAESARLQPNWANLKPHERASLLYKIAQGIRDNAEHLAQLQRLDNGKPINETRALVASAAGTFQYFASACETLEDLVTPVRGEFLTMSLHEPLGVVAAITPWNSPIASEAQKIAPALAAGCAIIIKPAEITPRMAIELTRIILEAGVPAGIVSVLPGKGSIVGEALVKHPLIKRVAFTGGTTVGLGQYR
jgi:betaine-aldehyde dehydrogenase